MARGSRGFTLLEIIVVISIVGVVLLIAIPEYNAYLQKETLRTTAEQLVSDLKLAEEEAKKSGVGAAYNPYPQSSLHSLTLWDKNEKVIFFHSIPPNIIISAQGKMSNPNVNSPCQGTVLFDLDQAAYFAFNPGGSLSHYSTVSITLSDATDHYPITVDGRSGNVTIGALTKGSAGGGTSGKNMSHCFD